MDDENRRFFYSLAGGAAISGFIFWCAFTHFWLLEAIAAAITIDVLYWFRYGGRNEWKQLHRRGRKRQLREFKVTVAVLAFITVAITIAVLYPQ